MLLALLFSLTLNVAYAIAMSGAGGTAEKKPDDDNRFDDFWIDGGGPCP